MRPSDIAALISGQHGALRATLDELSTVAKTLLTGGPAALKRTLALSRVLRGDLKRHIVMESRVLVPALRNADAWGVIRADKLIARLRTRRHELRRFCAACVRAQQGSLGSEIDRFIHDRRVDMAHAERHVWGPAVLRDDVLGIDVDGG